MSQLKSIKTIGRMLFLEATSRNFCLNCETYEICKTVICVTCKKCWNCCHCAVNKVSSRDECGCVHCVWHNNIIKKRDAKNKL